MASDIRDAGMADGDTGVSVSRLYREMVESGVVDSDADGDIPEHKSKAVLTSVTNTLFDDPFAFDESVVKGNLDEILLMLVALRDSDTHGKGLMEDLETVFDADLSPGTVYPRLHDLDDNDLLRVQELVRTKEYRIDDDEDARDRIEEAMRQHLALGFFFYAARDEL
jgi:hypothetical protein